MLNLTRRNLQGITIMSVSRLGKQSGAESIRPRKLLVTLGSEQQVHDVLQSVTRLCQLNKDRKASGWVLKSHPLTQTPTFLAMPMHSSCQVIREKSATITFYGSWHCCLQRYTAASVPCPCSYACSPVSMPAVWPMP